MARVHPKTNGRSPVLLAARHGRGSLTLERVIRRQFTWQLQRVFTGDEALRPLGNGPVDLVLIDAGIPVVSAPELCRIIRSRPSTASVPIVVAEFDRVNPDREALAFSAGADEYLDATASPTAALDRIQSLLVRRKSGAVPPPIHQYRNGGLFASFEDVFVSVDGQPLVMPRLEFALFRYFVERRNQLVTRHDLFRDVWHGKGAADNRTIDVHVCRLRRKLGRCGHHIQTLVAMGYRFVDETSLPVARS